MINRLKLDPNLPVWFAMRATRKREIKTQEYLKEEGVDSFIPMRMETTVVRGKKQRLLKPVISNMIFVFDTPKHIVEVRERVPFLQFQTKVEQKLSYPITIPTKDMVDFIKLYQTTAIEDLTYLDPSDPKLKLGKRVKIHSHGAPLDGVEGRLVKIEGRRNRQFTISVGELIVVAAAVDIDIIEVL